jgi:hypothetical protein
MYTDHCEWETSGVTELYAICAMSYTSLSRSLRIEIEDNERYSRVT